MDDSWLLRISKQSPWTLSVLAVKKCTAGRREKFQAEHGLTWPFLPVLQRGVVLQALRNMTFFWWCLVEFLPKLYSFALHQQYLNPLACWLYACCLCKYIKCIYRIKANMCTTHVYIHIYMYTYNIYTCIYIYLYLYIYIFIYKYVYIHTYV